LGGARIYVAEADSDGVAYTPEGSDQSITYGSWAALDPATGAILWQTPDPSGGTDPGAVSSADGVVYAASMTGHMYALSGATGQVLWSFTGSGSSIAGPAIVDGVVYWGMVTPTSAGRGARPSTPSTRHPQVMAGPDQEASGRLVVRSAPMAPGPMAVWFR